MGSWVMGLLVLVLAFGTVDPWGRMVWVVRRFAKMLIGERSMGENNGPYL